MRIRWLTQWWIVAGAFVLAAACDDPGPTTPSGPVPEILRVEPSEVVPGPGPQTLLVTGQNFATGLTVLVTPPGGTRTELGGDAIQAVQNVSFQVSVPFETAGQYKLAVRLLNGAESSEFTITARAPDSTTPRIDSVTPATLQTGPATTVVTLSGANFTQGSTVNFTRPNGVTTVLAAGSITGISASAIQLSLLFNLPGTYSFSVTSSQGQTSNTVTLTAF